MIPCLPGQPRAQEWFEDSPIRAEFEEDGNGLDGARFPIRGGPRDSPIMAHVVSDVQEAER